MANISPLQPTLRLSEQDFHKMCLDKLKESKSRPDTERIATLEEIIEALLLRGLDSLE